jgi:O-antigen ligase
MKIVINNRWLTAKLLLLALMFCPVTLAVGGSGVSANYLFVLLFITGSIKAPARWNTIAYLYVLFCVISYLLGVFIFSKFDYYFLLRQSISFIIFLLPIFILFIRVPYSIDDICRMAFLVSCLYSAYTLWIVLSHGIWPIYDTFAARAYLGNFVPDYPQRFIMIILFSVFYWISCITPRSSKNSFFRHPGLDPESKNCSTMEDSSFRRNDKGAGLIVLCKGLALNAWNYLSILLLLFSVYISFTRAAWLGLGAGFIAYLFAVLWKARHGVKLRFNFINSFKWFTFVGIVALIAIVTLAAKPKMIEDILLHQNRIEDAVSGFFNEPSGFNPKGSEGIRLQIWSAILDIVAISPITGTGFAGTHQFLDANWGSAHSQYMDILLRTGLIGLAFYLYLWVTILRYYLTMPGIFAGLIAFLVFGLFQETTKFSYGALLFFLLLNKVYDGKSIKTIKQCS